MYFNLICTNICYQILTIYINKWHIFFINDNLCFTTAMFS